MQRTRSCIFCRIIRRDIPAAEVLRTDQLVVIMDKYPINRGHLLIIPSKHYENLLEMPIGEVAILYSHVPRIADAVVSTVKADGFNVGQNNGLAANQIVPHVHVHIVPRFQDDSPDGRWPARTVASYDHLTQLAARVRDSINSKPSGLALAESPK